jgi:hypothetical protein
VLDNDNKREKSKNEAQFSMFLSLCPEKNFSPSILRKHKAGKTLAEKGNSVERIGLGKKITKLTCFDVKFKLPLKHLFGIWKRVHPISMVGLPSEKHLGCRLVFGDNNNCDGN